ncbi:MAG TPA: hypothetical protein VFY97_09255 [Rhodanobacteraceae bacterium]|nr:hypothetical protein [Rhodanobacteraceae bacterium]
MADIVAPLVIGVTSHRNLVATEVAGLHARVRDFFGGLQRDFPGLPLVVISPLAEGGDQLVAEEALAVGARLIAPLPLPRDLYLQDFADAEARARFDALRARAGVIELPLLSGSTRESVALRGPERDRQYTQAGVFTASHSHILLALWDGRPSDRLGGTAQIVRFHMDGIPPGAFDRRRTRRVSLDTGDESLLFHVACSRDHGADGSSPPLAPLQALEARWVTDRGASAAVDGMPAEFRGMFGRMQQFNADADRHRDDIAQAAPAAADEMASADCQPSAPALFGAADWLAIHCQRQLVQAMRAVYTLAVLMGIAFVYYSDTPSGLPGQAETIYAFVMLFAAGALLAWLAGRREWHRKYIDYRALAEGLRVQEYWRRAQVGAGDAGAFAHDSFMQKQDVELGWIRHVMRTAALTATFATARGEMAQVIAEWIGTADGDGQLGYYAHKARQRRRTHHRYEAIARILLAGAVATSLFLALFNHWLDTDTANWLVALMGVLAVVAAVRESYAFHKADKELINQYQYMGAIFASARRQLDATTDPAMQRAILRALGDAALAEHAEWALLHRQRPLEAGKM